MFMDPLCRPQLLHHRPRARRRVGRGGGQWVWDNWDDVVALSFLSYDDNFYELLPYEAITEEEYNRRKAAMKPFNPSLISRYEHEESELDIGESECAGGVCPVR